MSDANGFPFACIYCRDDLHKTGWSLVHGRLTSDEARRIAAGIARLPELLKFVSAFLREAAATGRWLRYDDLVFPERHDDIPRMKRIKDLDKYLVRSSGWR